MIIHDIEIRGSIILDMVTLPPASEDAWRSFFAAVLGSPIRVWIAIAAVRRPSSPHPSPSNT